MGTPYGFGRHSKCLIALLGHRRHDTDIGLKHIEIDKHRGNGQVIVLDHRQQLLVIPRLFVVPLSPSLSRFDRDKKQHQRQNKP